MYFGFNLDLNEDFFDSSHYSFNKCYEIGHKLLTNNEKIIEKRIIEKTIGSFKNRDGTISASQMTENWFPQIKSDIFISHSHCDEDLAIAISGWLYRIFGLNCFIDSCIWGCSTKLLKNIDNEYCLMPNKKYNYKKRNISTSHVHMMLSTALFKMIDNTESIFFLNTPNSITLDDISSGSPQTYSPWIYFEIVVTQLIRKKRSREHPHLHIFSESVDSMVCYDDLDISHLRKLDIEDMDEWECEWHSNKDRCALDTLYRLMGFFN